MISRAGFDITVVTCAQLQSSPNILSSYDTIFYFGPLNYSTAGATPSPSVSSPALPSAVDTMLNGGAKVIVVPTADPSFSEHNFYGLTLETNVEYGTTLGGSTIQVINPNKMSNAFNSNSSAYNNGMLSHLMFLGPYGDGATPDPALQANWCSDLTTTYQTANQSTTFHGFLLDSTDRLGLLVALTIAYPASSAMWDDNIANSASYLNPGAPYAAGNFDFTDPFLAAQLSQTWNAKGNSQQCGLPCAETDAGGSGFVNVVGMGKPVIYLYPPQEEDVTVKLAFDGQLVTTYPKFDDSLGGWHVHARPDGQMIDPRDNQEYNYIYWNGITESFVPSFAEGYVVKGEDTRAFLQHTLADMGMTPREYNDMIVYWLPYMEHHPYNLISFATSSYTDLAKMEITPKPDALLRVFMTFEALAQPIAVTSPAQPSGFKRQGFTVVEWGGTEINGDWHVVQ